MHFVAAAACAAAFAVAAADSARTAAPAAPAGKGADLLCAAAARYQGQQNFEAAGVVRATVGAGETQDEQVVPFGVALATGGRQREDYGEGEYRGRVVSDGRYLWTWISVLGQYTRYRGAGPTLDSLARAHRDPQPPAAVTGLVSAPAAGAATGLVSAEWLREDTLRAADRVHRCDVIAAVYAARNPADTTRTRRELWVSREDGLVWRHGFRQEQRINETGQFIQRSQFVTFTRARLGGSPADSLFAFAAPAGAREVLAFEQPGSRAMNLTGLAAPPFALRDLAGAQHDLASLSGKVILLDFWASWCGPCRTTMPALDRLTREYADKGLVVYSVNLREKPETAAAYMKKYGYSMTTLLDPDGSTAQRYGVSAIPVMVVVGRDGKVAAHLTGAHGESTMRAALERAGIQ